MIDDWWFRIKFFVNTLVFTRKGNRLMRYAVPVVLSVLVLSAKIFFYDFLGGSPFLLLNFAVILSAIYGGFGPGLVATIFPVLLYQFLFLQPASSSENGDYINTIVFLIEGVLISVVSEARKQAEDEKDTFMGLASHELKNPLATIKVYANLLQRQAKKMKKDKVFDYANKIDNHVVKINDLINDLLDVAKIQSGKLSYNDELFSIYDLLREIVSDQNLIFNTHTISLKGFSKKVILGDRYRIGQVFINIISNAVKYSPKANKTVVTVQDVTHGVLVKVRDYGIGIGFKDQRKVFDRFFRGRVTGSKIHGLGMGLYISNEIVKRHSGKIWLKSVVGRGTTFYVILPAKKKEG
jgi:signal transduction histidine kinase